MNAQLQAQSRAAFNASFPTPSFTPQRSSILQRKCACGGTPGPTGECEGCRKKRLSLQGNRGGQNDPGEAPPIVHEVLRSLGQPLDREMQDFFGPRFGHDFSQVRVHTDTKAAKSASAVNALAYTVGNSVVFGAGHYDTTTFAGQNLLAHELTHVVQQGFAQGFGTHLTVDRADSAAEREAENVASTFDRPGRVAVGLPQPLQLSRYRLNASYNDCNKAPYTLATVQNATQRAFNTVESSECIRDKSLRHKILSEFEGLEVDCEQGGADKPCGMASRYFTQTVNIYPKSLNPANCGDLASTILHEAIHLTEWRFFGHGELADACEKACFGYGTGDASKCRETGHPVTGAVINGLGGAVVGGLVGGPIGALVGGGLGAFLGAGIGDIF
jgi:Domain of unknown function (DUF4157)